MSENVRARVARYEVYRSNLRRYAKNPEIKSSITILMSVVLVAVFLIFAIQPTLVQIAKLKTEVDASQKILTTLTDKAATLNRISTKWSQAESKIPYLDTAIPLAPEYRTFNKELAYLAQEAGVTIATLTVGESLMFAQGISPYTKSKYMSPIELPFTIGVVGGYEQIIGFWLSVVQMDRVASISNVIFTPDNQSDSNVPIITFNITGVAYYMADEKILKPLLGISEKATNEAPKEEISNVE